MARDNSKLSSALKNFNIWDLTPVYNWPFKKTLSVQKAFWRGDRKPSLSISKDGFKWIDFGTNKSGDQINLISEIHGISNSKACAEFMKMAEGVGVVLPMPKQSARSKSHIVKKPNLPKLDVPTADIIRRIVLLRELPSDRGVCEAIRRGILWYGIVQDCAQFNVPVFVFTDSVRINAQARRLDGRTWNLSDKPKTKVLRPPGGQEVNWPIGCGALSGENLVILVEGEGDLLAAMELAQIQMGERIREIGFCFLSGITRSISQKAINRLKGRRVRIVPHADTDPDKGAKSADGWSSLLAEHGVPAEIFSLEGKVNAAGVQFKDLGEICSAITKNEVSNEAVKAISRELFYKII